MTFDNHELLDFTADLKKAVAAAEPRVAKTMKQAAVEVKRSWQENAWSMVNSSRVKHFPATITTESEGELRWLIGPERDRTQGFLGALLEYGAVYSAPHNLMKDAVDKNEPKISQAVIDDIYRELKRII